MGKLPRQKGIICHPRSVLRNWICQIVLLDVSILIREKFFFVCKAQSSYYQWVYKKQQNKNMKLLESSRFEAINSALNMFTGDCNIIGR